jgi:hypothetical protein
MAGVSDYNGQPLAVGDPVTGWYDSVQYTGTVTAIAPQYQGCGYRHITVLRSDTGTGHETFSDSVIRIT